MYKLLNYIKQWYYKTFPLYMYNSLVGYIYTVRDAEDEQIGSYTDITTTSNENIAMNIRNLSIENRKLILHKVNVAMALGNFEFKLKGKEWLRTTQKN